MPYQRVISSLGCAELNLGDTLALAARHQIEGIELRALGGTVALPAYLTAQHGSPHALSRQIANATARVTAFDTSLRLTDTADDARKSFLEFVPWAEGLGVRWLRVFDGDCGKSEASQRIALDTLRWWRGLREGAGWQVDLMVETHDNLLSIDKILAFLSAAPSGTKILWDSHHTWKLGRENPVATWRGIASHVAHIHVKDSVSRPDGGYAYTSPGNGEFPMAPLARILRAEYSGGVSLEWERLWHPELSPLESALTTAAANNWW